MLLRFRLVPSVAYRALRAVFCCEDASIGIFHPVVASDARAVALSGPANSVTLARHAREMQEKSAPPTLHMQSRFYNFFLRYIVVLVVARDFK